ncbi:MAG: CPBP family intramembrane metalloprotease [Clostridia bacterium]|nr:CPBP family intramembrane metalloprotease [Clostridia bacterium]
MNLGMEKSSIIERVKNNPALWTIAMYALIAGVFKTSVDKIHNMIGIEKSYLYVLFYLVFSFTVLILFDKYYSPEYKGNSLSSKKIFKGILFLVPTYLACALMDFLVFIQVGGITFDFYEFFAGLRPGVFEEVLCRGLIIPVLLFGCKKNNIFKAAFISSALFGVWHIMNFFYGASLRSTAIQVVYAFGIGLVFAAVYLRTGSLWPSIIVHSLIDCTANIAEIGIKLLQTKEAASELGEQAAETATQTSGLSLNDGFLLFAFLVTFISGLILLRKTKHNEIVSIWKDRSSKTII